MDIGKLIELPKNSNFILFNTIYHKKISEDHEDAITLIFKNMSTGEKIVKDIINPQIEVYVANSDVELGTYNHIDIDLKDTHIEDVSFRNVERDLAKLIGNEEFYWNCIRERRFDDIKQIQEYNRFFSSDRNIEDFYRYKCLKHFGMKDLTNTTKGYLDIEADIRKGKIDFKTGTGTAPINAITLIDGSDKVSYTVLLKDKDLPQLDDVMNRASELVKEANDMNKDLFGDFKYKITWVDTEVEVIELIFKIIHTLKLDFIEIWNMGFDIPYMMDRLAKNGVDPKDIMCHPDFKYKECYFVRDRNNFEAKKKTDYTVISGYTIFVDGLINYASIRKGQGQMDSNKLDYVGEKEIGIKKLEYEGHIKDFAYNDYYRFILYNIRDCLVMLGIENKTNDIDTIFYRSYESSTRLNKVFKEITFLTNVAFDYFMSIGIVLGNNVNAIRYNRENDNELIEEDDDEVRFKGMCLVPILL